MISYKYVKTSGTGTSFHWKILLLFCGKVWQPCTYTPRTLASEVQEGLSWRSGLGKEEEEAVRGCGGEEVK